MSSQSRNSRGSRLQKLRQRQEHPQAEDAIEVAGGAVPAAAPSSVLPEPFRTTNTAASPTIDPYVGRLERFELFCTNQSYYLVGTNKLNTAYRVLKMDRTLIERPTAPQSPEKSTPRAPAPTDKNTKSNSATTSTSNTTTENNQRK